MDASLWSNILDMVLTYKGPLIAGVGFVLVFFVLWLAFRGLRLWYWKVNDSQRALERIDEELQNLRTELNSRPQMPVTQIIQTPTAQQPSAYVTYPIQPGQPVPSAPARATATVSHSQSTVNSAAAAYMQATPVKATKISPQPAAYAAPAQEAGATFEHLGDMMIEEWPEEEQTINRYETRECNRDKMGRVHSREEIEANIK